ncbi:MULTISPECIES: hypothetical protein [unclassified Streptomyces]|uniref:hypothetical protein n=1 Tax=unclassified Streptomyces TaxID=2593676 RepID=UPI0038281CDA
MSNDISIERAPGADGGISITVTVSPTVLSALQKDGHWTEALDASQVSGAGPALEKFVINVI